MPDLESQSHSGRHRIASRRSIDRRRSCVCVRTVEIVPSGCTWRCSRSYPQSDADPSQNSNHCPKSTGCPVARASTAFPAIHKSRSSRSRRDWRASSNTSSPALSNNTVAPTTNPASFGLALISFIMPPSPYPVVFFQSSACLMSRLAALVSLSRIQSETPRSATLAASSSNAFSSGESRRCNR